MREYSTFRERLLGYSLLASVLANVTLIVMVGNSDIFQVEATKQALQQAKVVHIRPPVKKRPPPPNPQQVHPPPPPPQPRPQVVHQVTPPPVVHTPPPPAPIVASPKG